MKKLIWVVFAFFSPLILAGLALAQQGPQRPQQGQQFQQQNQPQGERYRARITGTAQDGSPLAVTTGSEWPSREACMQQAGQAYPGQLVDALAKSGIARDLSIQCRKVPTRAGAASIVPPQGGGNVGR